MPDNGPFISCNNCGLRKEWTTTRDATSGELVKSLPDKFRMTPKTTSGDAYFCSNNCEHVWKSTREWKIPDQYQGFSVPPKVTPMGEEPAATEAPQDDGPKPSGKVWRASYLGTYKRGQDARVGGEPMSANPHRYGDGRYDAWRDGWLSVKDDQKESVAS